MQAGSRMIKLGLNKILWVMMASLLMTLSACANKNKTVDDVRTVFIGPEKIDCVGVAPMQCMQIKEKANAPWELFYSQIEGFNFVAGYNYILQVKVERRENVPADASSLRWSLVKVVSQTPVAK